jgi:hypothetical protein
MKAQLRRAHVRLDITLETGERKSVIISHRPQEGLPPPLLLNLMLVSLAQFGIDLVDELEQPAGPALVGMLVDEAEGQRSDLPDTDRPPAPSSGDDLAPPVAAPVGAFVHIPPPPASDSSDHAPPRPAEIVHRPPPVPDRLPPGPVIVVNDPGAPPPPMAPPGVTVTAPATPTAGADNAPPVQPPAVTSAPLVPTPAAHAPMARSAYPPSSVVVRATQGMQPAAAAPDNSAPIRVATASVVVGGTSTPVSSSPVPAPATVPSSTENDNAPPVKQ